MAVFTLVCLCITLWQGGRMLAGVTTWDESGLKLVLAQLGVLFCGAFAYAAWKQHCDEPADSGVAVALWLLLFLELPVLLGWGAWSSYTDSRNFVDSGIAVTGRIVDHDHPRRSRGKRSNLILIYEYRTTDGLTLRGRQVDETWSFVPSRKPGYIEPENRLGADIPVLYMPDAPERSTLNRFAELWSLTIVITAGTVVTACIFIFIVARLIRGNRPKYRRRKRWRR
jgi:hypothetical protein